MKHKKVAPEISEYYRKLARKGVQKRHEKLLKAKKVDVFNSKQ